MKYFTDCKTAEELKKEYKIQTKKLHPDNGGNEKALLSLASEDQFTCQSFLSDDELIKKAEKAYGIAK